MNCLALALGEHLGGLMIVAAAAAFYVASRAAGDALSHPDASYDNLASPIISPFRHALAQWASIALVALFATWLDHPEIAVGVIFSTSVAALSLHLGVAIVTGSHHDRHRVIPLRAWALVLPTAVLALVIGFSGKLTLVHAIVLAMQGVLVASVWAPQAREAANPFAPTARISKERKLQLALAVMLGAIGASFAVYGAVRMSDETRIMSTGLVASAAIGPLLVLPMIGSASVLATEGQSQTAVGASVVMVFLNLCLLLPVCVTVWHVREMLTGVPAIEAGIPAATATTTATTRPSATAPAAATTPAEDSADALEAESEFDEGEEDPMAAVDDMPRVFSFPIATWRIDTVLLVLLGLVLLPVSLNLWEMRRAEGFLLVVVYACYLVVTTMLGRRW